jgi:ABC-type transport system substrate-binding protein
MPAGARSHRLAAVAITAGLLAGCTDHGGEPLVSSTTEATSSDDLVDGGTLHVGLAGAISIDPATTSLGSPAALMVLDLLYDGLTRLDETSTPTPAVATEWSHDAALTTWTFTLDADATFTSGRGVTSADVIASVERVVKAGDTSLAALELEPIQGFRPFVDGSAPSLAGLTAPDPQHVQIVTDTPLATLPTILASPVFGLVDTVSLRASVDAGAPGAELDLSGDWAIAEADDGGLLVERREDAAGHLDAVELRPYDDADAAYAAFEDGDVDWALVPPERYSDAVDDHGDDGITPFHAELFFGLRATSAVLGSAPLRQAIAAAIDRDEIVEAVYADRADPLATVVPDGVSGHVESRCPACGHDPARARSLLASAFPDGAVPTVPIDFDDTGSQREMAELVAEQLGAVGIPTQLRPTTRDAYEQLVASGGQELFSFGWIGGYASPDAYLAPLFASAADDNLTGFAAASVDASLGQARATDDGAAAQALWAAVEQHVLVEAVVVPIAQFRVQAVRSSRVRGLRTAVDGTVDWSAVWVTDGA